MKPDVTKLNRFAKWMWWLCKRDTEWGRGASFRNILIHSGCSETTCRRTLKKLIEMGLIVVGGKNPKKEDGWPGKLRYRTRGRVPKYWE